MDFALKAISPIKQCTYYVTVETLSIINVMSKNPFLRCCIVSVPSQWIVWILHGKVFVSFNFGIDVCSTRIYFGNYRFNAMRNCISSCSSKMVGNFETHWKKYDRVIKLLKLFAYVNWNWLQVSGKRREKKCYLILFEFGFAAHLFLNSIQCQF